MKSTSITLCDLTAVELEGILKAALEAGELVTNSTFSDCVDVWRIEFEAKYDQEIGLSDVLKAYFGNVTQSEELTASMASRRPTERWVKGGCYALPCEGELKEYVLDRTHGNWADYDDSCRLLFMHCSEVHTRNGGNRAYDWLGYGFKSRHMIETLQKFVPNGYVLRVH